MSLKIAFRVDASRLIGTGHVIRCLSLANALSTEGVSCLFICREHKGHLIDLIRREGHEVLLLSAPSVYLSPDWKEWLGADWQSDAEQTLQALKRIHLDWLVVDHYALDARWEGRLRQNCERLMVIDDLADRLHDCDLLLDQNLVANLHERYVGLLPERGATLLGPTYALLQPVYEDMHKKARPRVGKPRRLFVFFGGVDDDKLTHTTLAALLTLDLSEIHVDVVVPDSNPHRDEIKTLLCGAHHICLHGTQPSLAPLLLDADLAIGAGGATSWERLCLGLPALVVTLAPNQRPIADELDKRGLVHWVGEKDSLRVDELAAKIHTILQQPLDEWSANCLKVVDGLGVRRVCAALLADKNTPLIARPISQFDEVQVLEWANDPLTRRNSFSSALITPESHHLWFARQLNNPQCHFYLIEIAGSLPAGQVRFQHEQDGWNVHFTMNPVLRGRGLGTALLKIGLKAFAQEQSGALVVGKVKPANHASCRMFESLGFNFVSAAGADVAIYQSKLF